MIRQSALDLAAWLVIRAPQTYGVVTTLSRGVMQSGSGRSLSHASGRLLCASRRRRVAGLATRETVSATTAGRDSSSATLKGSSLKRVVLRRRPCVQTENAQSAVRPSARSASASETLRRYARRTIGLLKPLVAVRLRLAMRIRENASARKGRTVVTEARVVPCNSVWITPGWKLRRARATCPCVIA